MDSLNITDKKKMNLWVLLYEMLTQLAVWEENINRKYNFPNAINHFHFLNPDLPSRHLFQQYITVKYFILSLLT